MKDEPRDPAVSTPSFRARAGQLRAALWRFQTLALSHRLFDGTPGPHVLRRSLFGRDLYVDISRSNVQRLLFLEGRRFLAERAVLARLLRPGMRVADVGANIGYYLLLFERAVGPSGRVLCFEPEPDNVAELRRNVERNQLGNVEVFPVAVGSAAGTVSFCRGTNGVVAGNGQGDVLVPVARLDDLATGPVDFLKVDVEGYEGHVLAGAERVLQEHRPILFVEIHPALLAPPYTVDGILAGLATRYSKMEMVEISPQGSFVAKVRARYLGEAVRRVPDPEALRAACREGRREEPFWVVCRP